MREPKYWKKFFKQKKGETKKKQKKKKEKQVYDALTYLKNLKNRYKFFRNKLFKIAKEKGLREAGRYFSRVESRKPWWWNDTACNIIWEELLAKSREAEKMREPRWEYLKSKDEARDAFMVEVLKTRDIRTLISRVTGLMSIAKGDALKELERIRLKLIELR